MGKRDGKQTRRAALRSLTDCEKQMSLLYREARNNLITPSEMTAFGQQIDRLHKQMIARQDLDITADLLAIEERLAALQEKR